MNDLPFLAGKGALLERMADQHHAPVKDPVLLARRPEMKGSQSWRELLDIGLEALRKTGLEIAGAKSVADAATAQLRQSNYSAAFDLLESSLLRLAIRELARPPIWNGPDAKLAFSGLAGYGRRTIGSDRELIPTAHWEAGDVDWSKWRLSVVGTGTIWTGIQIVDLKDLTATQNESVGKALAEPPPPKNPGRPHRPRGTSLEKPDARFVEKMHRLIVDGKASSPTDAASQLTERGKTAPGRGSAESRIRRLVSRYKKEYPDKQNNGE